MKLGFKQEALSHGGHSFRQDDPPCSACELVLPAGLSIETKEIESITKIEDDTIIMKELGTTTVYLKSDYLRNTENEKSYIMEFTNGRFIFFKKDTFKTQERYQELIKELQSKRKA